MQSSIPLDEMSTEEKLQIMESLWNDLCKRGAHEINSPGWHRHTLESREAALARGEDQIEDWETAKRKIHDDLT